MSHYFKNDPNLKSDIKEIEIEILNNSFFFLVDHGVFSKKRLDFGTKVLIESVDIKDDKHTVIDMGCGYGPISIAMAYKYPNKAIFAYDINRRAVDLTRRNAWKNNVKIEVFESNLFENVKVNADVIITNPPIRTGKENIFKLYQDAYDNLNVNGDLYVVIRMQQGAESTKKKLEEIFANITTLYGKKGYRVYKCTKLA